MIEIENLTRAKFHFPIIERRTPPAGSKRPGPLVETGRIVIGDRADRDVPAGERDPKTRPSPIVRLSEEEWTRLGERNQKAIEALVEKGALVKRAA